MVFLCPCTLFECHSLAGSRALVYRPDLTCLICANVQFTDRSMFVLLLCHMAGWFLIMAGCFIFMFVFAPAEFIQPNMS